MASAGAGIDWAGVMFAVCFQPSCIACLWPARALRGTRLCIQAESTTRDYKPFFCRRPPYLHRRSRPGSTGAWDLEVRVKKLVVISGKSERRKYEVDDDVKGGLGGWIGAVQGRRRKGGIAVAGGIFFTVLALPRAS